MGLSALQREFRSWLAADDADAARRMDLADTRGLAVYRTNYRGQLLDCLEASYPHTLAWLGEPAFRSAAADHIDRYPPHSWTLDDYADGFPAGLARQLHGDPEVAELARLELALAQAFVAADAIALDVHDLGAIAWDSAELRLVPSAAFLDLATNAADIWLALDAGRAPPPPAILPEPARLLVWRQDLVCCFRELMTPEGQLLHGATTGLRFNAMCEQLVSQRGAEDGIRLAGELLGRWARAGVLIR